MNEDKPDNRPVSEKLNEHIKKLRDSDMIDFTNKSDYAPKLNQIAKDFKCNYTTVFKEMKRVGKSEGVMVGDPEKKKKKINDKGGQTFNFQAKKSSMTETKLAKKTAQLEAKKKSIESDIKVSEMVMQSPVLEMMTTQNYYVLSMIKEMVKLTGVPVAPDENYKAVSKQLAFKELASGWQAPAIIGDILLCISMVGLFLIPAIPKIKEYLSDEKEDKEKTSEKPLDEIENKELSNGKKEEEKPNAVK